MQSLQKLCPQGVETGSVKISRQIEHKNCSSARKNLVEAISGGQQKERVGEYSQLDYLAVLIKVVIFCLDGVFKMYIVAFTCLKKDLLCRLMLFIMMLMAVEISFPFNTMVLDNILSVGLLTPYKTLQKVLGGG